MRQTIYKLLTKYAKLKFVLIVLLLSVMPCLKAFQYQDNYNTLIPFDVYLNSDKFEALKELTIKQGDRKTYCVHYENNPHYRIDSLEVDVYLNPTNTESPDTLNYSDYNVMYIVDKLNNHYYIFRTADDRVFFYDYDKQLVEEPVRQKRFLDLQGILGSMFYGLSDRKYGE